jgi:N-formylmaleamate deformylase
MGNGGWTSLWWSCAGRAQSVPGTSMPTSGDRAFVVRVTGTGPRSMILIPGFLSHGEVWDEVVAHVGTRYRCHVLTLAGFAGVPAVDGPLLPRVRDEIIAYIKETKLDHPVLVGHSLGGFLALWVGSTAPDLEGVSRGLRAT